MDGPILAIDRDDARPIGEQLVEALRRGILSGDLRTGDPLPSTRTLATELAVSRSSVVAAYERLAGEGYLEMRQGASTTVAALESRAVPEPVGRPGASEADRVDAPILADLNPGVPSTTRIDERAWRAAWREAASEPRPIPAWSPPPFGLLGLREQLADHLRRARGVACSADDVVVTAGTSEAVALVATALAALAGRPPRIGVEDPGYPTARRTLERRGVVTVPVQAGADGIRPAALDEAGALDAVMITPSHQYPLGGRLPVADRLGVLAWAERHDALVIEDDYDSEYRHTGAPLPALASLDARRSVLLGSFSKVLTPWIRLGYLVLPDHPGLRAAIAEIRADEQTPVAGPVQAAMAAFIRSGALRRHIAASRREYGHRRRLVVEALGDLPGHRLRAIDGGLHAVLELPDEASADLVATRLEAQGVLVAPLGRYAVTRPDEHPGIVIGYAGVSDTVLAEALARIRAEVGKAVARSAGSP
ncbi:PLP-dependent aminotransferase family protein [Agromyces sp. MMS24-JH15]|uniref:MocR-like pyridoxine biosynthesis transcription factor PdxR n=1 Tax=Agromyces sp. MMS24-JH15 TaxID=3243765 RepID=UPI0037486170